MFVLTIGLPDLHQQLIGLKAHAAWHSLEVALLHKCGPVSVVRQGLVA